MEGSPAERKGARFLDRTSGPGPLIPPRRASRVRFHRRRPAARAATHALFEDAKILSSLLNPTRMAAFGHTFPFYAGPKPTFPMDTTLAIIITIFLTALVTFIIILPGIRGKTRLFWLFRVVTSLFIGAVILVLSGLWARSASTHHTRPSVPSGSALMLGSMLGWEESTSHSQGGIPLLAAGQRDAVHACAGLWLPHAACHGHLPAVRTDLFLHGHDTHPTLSSAHGHCYAALSPWTCLLDHAEHRTALCAAGPGHGGGSQNEAPQTEGFLQSECRGEPWAGVES
ncbi:PREDICTED: dual oxidase maturation factor 1 isoform X7 [Myotis davidii]|uniref:dual oxidase maturation factor 1 isoform X7 n=1 Tax=Myotis davidii TaxID=225400 RepID=UPI000767093D|nr:PREDICTED: dual oxidase maturation factor 1 isoform X7 [Myotis davidii]